MEAQPSANSHPEPDQNTETSPMETTETPSPPAASDSPPNATASDATAPDTTAQPSDPSDSNPPQSSTSATTTPPPPQDGFAEFMQLGDAAARTTTPPTQPSAHPPSSSPLSFLTGLFSKATTTLESTLQTATQELSTATQELSHVSSDALQSATQAGSTALTSVTDLVAELSGSPTTRSAPTTSFPPSTTSLKSFNTPYPPLLHLRTTSAAHVVVTSTALFRFDESRREFPLHISWTDDGAHAISTPAPPDNSRRQRKPVVAVAAVALEDDQVCLAHEDGALRVFSVSMQRFGIHLRASPAEEAVATTLHAFGGRIYVGDAEGLVRIVDARSLTTMAVLMPPELCMTMIGAAAGYAGVSVVTVANEMFVGFEDGVVGVGNVEGERVGRPFVAQGKSVKGMVTFLEGALVLCCGGEEDPSLTLCEGLTGRCFVRRMLPYVPSSVTRVKGGGGVCPSENAFVVGGEGGEVEIFRIVVLSPRRIEVRLVRRISERVRGRGRGVMSVTYVREEGVLCALGRNGEVRRWKLSALDASSLVLLPGQRGGMYNEENIEEGMEREFANLQGSRISSVGGVLEAQNVLASILDEEGVSEVIKDELVLQFQRTQADMLVKVSQADTELRRAGRRISARFLPGVKATVDGEVERKLARAVKRTAVFEIEFATRRHKESLTEIGGAAIAKLKRLLLDALKGIEGLAHIEAEARRLDGSG